MPVSPPVPDITLDLAGASCPHLLITIIAAMRALEPGQRLCVRATDLSAPSHVTAWSRQSGQKLLDLYQENGVFVFWLQRVATLEWARQPDS